MIQQSLQFFFRHGCTDITITDQGSEFVNEVADNLYRMTGVEYRVASAYHPQTNGLVERFNQTLQKGLVKLTEDEVDWDLHIDDVLFAYRTSMHASSKYTPFFLMYNRYVLVFF